MYNEEDYFDLYFFLLRTATLIIVVGVHRGTRVCKLKRHTFLPWFRFAFILDIILATQPPWWAGPQHKVLYTPRQLGVSLAICTAYVSPVLWWISCMETKRKGLAVLVAFAMLFFRATMSMLERESTVLSWTEAALAGSYLWLSLSLPHSSHNDNSKPKIPREPNFDAFIV